MSLWKRSNSSAANEAPGPRAVGMRSRADTKACRDEVRQGSRGFTLVELLVVIAIIGILAGLLLPALARAQQQGQMARCISNLRQIDLAVRQYVGDYADKYPTVSGAVWQSFRYGGGDPAPPAQTKFGLESASDRLLYPYTKTSYEVYHCPTDRGSRVDVGPKPPFDTLYQWLGTSYKYNWHLWGNVPTAEVERDHIWGCAGKAEGNYISTPSEYILFHEPPATPYYDGTWYYFFWHEARGPGTISNLDDRRDRFISPVLFGDGHAKKQDFTRVITHLPEYPCEPQPDWYWYEPLPQSQ
jgi:prepilin-type N-terminal cleavage/methylation domain-containing protein